MAPLRFERPIKGPAVAGGRDHDRRAVVLERSEEEAGGHRDELVVVVVDADDVIGPQASAGLTTTEWGYPAAPSAKPGTGRRRTSRCGCRLRRVGAHRCQRMREQSRHLHLADADLRSAICDCVRPRDESQLDDEPFPLGQRRDERRGEQAALDDLVGPELRVVGQPHRGVGPGAGIAGHSSEVVP